MRYELLIKGGKVIDPAQHIHGLRDIGVNKGKIAALLTEIPINDAKKVINAKGMLVTPGLIDMHVHVAEAIMPVAIAPDKPGVLVGVTTVCDAGSTGYVNFTGFKKLIIPNAQTDIFCYLHLSPTGQATLPEICWQDVNPERMLEIIEENRNIIKGIKLRAGAGVVENLTLEVVNTAKRVGDKAGLPIAVHIGIGLKETISDDILIKFTRGMLDLLDKGDILVHPYTHRKGGVIKPDGTVLPELREAIERGVALDLACGKSNFSFQVARKGIEQGILPTTLSTDTTLTNINTPVVFSLPVIMSKFLELGLSLDQVIEKTTINPARVLGEEKGRGSLRVGIPADITILELTEGDFLFTDGLAGNMLKGKLLLVPKLTIKHGVEIATRPRFRNYIPGEPVPLTKGA